MVRWRESKNHQEQSQLLRNNMNKVTTVSLRNQGISPKKARLVINSIRGLSVNKALVTLDLQDKKGSLIVLQLLKNAVDAAKAKDFKSDDLMVGEVICQEGRKLKRSLVKARGRSTQFKKRMSHLKISLSKIEEAKTEEKVKPSGKSKKIIKDRKIAGKDKE